MEIITGHTGTGHVYAIDDAILNKIRIGQGDYILPFGGKLAMTKTSVYQVTVADGYFMTQGRLGVIRNGDEYTYTFDTTISEGQYKPYLLVAEYTNTDGVEAFNPVFIEGAVSTSSTPDTPSYTTGDIDSGQKNQTPLWEVVLKGVSGSKAEIASITQVATSIEAATIDEINQKIANLSSTIDSDITTQIGEKFTNLETEVNTKLDSLQVSYYVAGNTIEMSSSDANLVNGCPCAGYLTSSGKSIVFTIPTKPILGSAVTIKNLNIVCRYSTGGYPVIKNSSKSFTNLGSSAVTIVSDGNIKVAGVTSVTSVRTDSGVVVTINLKYALRKSNKKSNATNNQPLSINLTSCAIVVS